MSRIRIVGGTITKTTVGDHNIYSDGNIVYSSGKAITETSDTGINYGEPKDAPVPKKIEATDFDITFELDKKETTLVPFGILDFKNKEENQFFKFKLKISGQGINQWQLDVKNEDGIIYTCYSATNELSEVVITSKTKKSGKSISKEEPENKKSESFWPAGEYIIFWDGFDNNEIYDTTKFNSKNLKAIITGIKDGKQKTATIDFSANYSQVQWTDVKIDKKKKRIDVNLRVNLIDGGEQGLGCNIDTEFSLFPKSAVEICDWDKVPEKVTSKYKIDPLKTRTKTFEELKKYVLDGLNYYWSRNSGRGKNVVLDGMAYEIYVKALNSGEKGKTLNNIPLIFNTNGKSSRSGNTGGAYPDGNLDDEFMEALPNGIVQRISYNTGYVKNDWESDSLDGWRFYNDSDSGGAFDAISKFKETAAHEIGHEILQAYGGTVYSWQHKGSSYYLPQNTKPMAGKESIIEKYVYIDYMNKSSGEEYPTKGEIDLMKYYNNTPNPIDQKRLIAIPKDVLSLVWLSKIKIK